MIFHMKDFDMVRRFWSVLKAYPLGYLIRFNFMVFESPHSDLDLELHFLTNISDQIDNSELAKELGIDSQMAYTYIYVSRHSFSKLYTHVHLSEVYPNLYHLMYQ